MKNFLVLALSVLVSSSALAAGPVCGRVTALENAPINTACQASVVGVATASLNCLAKEWVINSDVVTTFTLKFRYTYGAASAVHVYFDKAGDPNGWEPESVMSQVANVYTPGNIDVNYPTNSANGSFNITYVPSTKYFRIRIVGTSANTSDLFSRVEVCTKN